MKRKWLAIGIILLFIVTCIIPAFAEDVNKSTHQTSQGNWFYVGGNGPGNYTKIQDAFDNASDGDTVFVYSGFYQEGDIIVTDKSYINIIGEDKNSTIVDGSDKEYVFFLNWTSSNSRISGFTIQNATQTGIRVYSDNNTISDNIIQNIVQGNKPKAIFIGFANNNSIYGNIISDNFFGIVVSNPYTNDNKIEKNIIENNSYGILIQEFVSNTYVAYNSIKNNFNYGIFIDDCSDTVVEKNNIYNNHPDATFIIFFDILKLRFIKTTWNENYWGKLLLKHKFISGLWEITFFSWPPGEDYSKIRWINFDWNPAKEPYEVGG